MLQPEFDSSLGDPARLIRVRRREPLFGRDGAEGAVSGAGFSQDQESGRALAEAFPLIGTERPLADGIETMALE